MRDHVRTDSAENCTTSGSHEPTAHLVTGESSSRTAQHSRPETLLTLWATGTRRVALLVRGRCRAVVRGALALGVRVLRGVGRVAAVLGRHRRAAVARTTGVLALRGRIALIAGGRALAVLRLAVGLLLLLSLMSAFMSPRFARGFSIKVSIQRVAL